MPLPVEDIGYDVSRQDGVTVIRPMPVAALPVEALPAAEPQEAPSIFSSVLDRLSGMAKGFAQYDRQLTEDVLSAPAKIIESPAILDEAMRRLTGSYGRERYQTWPEKLVRDAIAAPHDVMEKGASTEELIKPAMDISALAGTGGLAGGVGAEGVALGSTPMLRPALKYGEKLYKGKEGQQHLDVLPKELQSEFTRQAMSGEDISNFNFGFVNHKGQFLDREAALKYAIDNGLASPHDAQFGVLTSTMFNDNRVGTAMGALEKSYPMAPKDRWYGEANFASNGGRLETMTPDEFLAKSRPMKMDKITRENIDDLKKHIQEGGELDPLNLFKNGKEDGRHRAHAAKELGIKEVPVVNYRDIEKAPTFYSAVERVIETIPQAKATGDQWLSTLSNKAGIKGEELDWTGLRDFLKGKDNVTKQELQEHLKANQISFDEVWKGTRETKLDQWKVIRQDGHVDSTWTSAESAAKQAERIGGTVKEQHEIKPMDNSKYSKWQLPGGENYRELLMTLPGAGSELARLLKYNPNIAPTLNEFKSLADVDLATKYNSYFREATKGQDKEAVFKAIQEAKKLPEEYGGYKSSHWDEPNTLVHMRMNDRRMLDGGKPANERKVISDWPNEKKSLHLEEIQSDWHQAGRKSGYMKGKLSEAERKEMDQLRTELSGVMKPDNLERYRQLYARDTGTETGIPDAPFKKNWHELALKRAIREAAENGYDRLSWTPGEAQAARYDLSKHADQVSYIPATKELIVTKDGKAVMHQQNINPDKLPDYVGKEVADKLLKSSDVQGKDAAKTPFKQLTGLDLKVGGEGMKGFYDQIVPKAVEKLTGEKVQKGNLKSNGYKIEKDGDYYFVIDPKGNRLDQRFTSKLQAERIAASEADDPIFYIDITPALKEKALKGFPLFSAPLPIVDNK